MEMKETAFICNSATEKSLFLLDELGRATSNEDGVAVAWAVSEFLLTKRAITFFVTHYPQISKLAAVYPNVQNQHLGSHISSSNNQDESSIHYTHKVLAGPCAASGDYGVEMSVSCGFPQDVVENARRIRRQVQEKMPMADLCKHHNNDSVDPELVKHMNNAKEILCNLSKHLASLKESEGRLNSDAKRVFLQELRDRLVPTGDVSLIKMIRNLLLNESKDVAIAFSAVKKQMPEESYIIAAHTKDCHPETSLSEKSIPEISDSSCVNDQTRCVGKRPSLNKSKSGNEPKMSDDIQQMKSPEVTKEAVANSVMDNIFSKKRARSDSNSSSHSNSSDSSSSDENSTSSQCSSSSSSISDMES